MLILKLFYWFFYISFSFYFKTVSTFNLISRLLVLALPNPPISKQIFRKFLNLTLMHNSTLDNSRQDLGPHYGRNFCYLGRLGELFLISSVGEVCMF